MDSNIGMLEEKLKSLLGQLKAECGVFERIVYKNKNQHRRSSYFQYLLKMRRDLRLLQSAKLEDLLGSSFQVITGKKPKLKVHLLESLKRGKCDSRYHNFMERLLGAARLLSQMVEPMLKAATEISTLLARSFFMGFSLTILALLARLRVLVQQILVDVVSVFNTVSTLSQTKQSVKLNQEGIEVFREYYPTNEEYVTLECIWKMEKFMLVESSHKRERKAQQEDVGKKVAVEDSSVRYQSIESFLGDDEHDSNKAEEDLTNVSKEKTNMSTTPTPIESVDGELVDANAIPETSSSSPSSKRLKVESAVRKVAFVSVKRTAPPTKDSSDVHFQETEKKSSDGEDKFYNLLTGGNLKDGLF